MNTKFVLVRLNRFGVFVDVVGIYATRKLANAEAKRRTNPRSESSWHVIGRPYQYLSVELMKEREGE